MKQYPLTLTFRILALAPQATMTDAIGGVVLYVRQKLFKLKESITVFADVEQTRPIFYINADRILDFSPRFTFIDAHGNVVGAVKRFGARSLWRAHFEVQNGDVPE